GYTAAAPAGCHRPAPPGSGRPPAGWLAAGWEGGRPATSAAGGGTGTARRAEADAAECATGPGGAPPRPASGQRNGLRSRSRSRRSSSSAVGYRRHPSVGTDHQLTSRLRAPRVARPKIGRASGRERVEGGGGGG